MPRILFTPLHVLSSPIRTENSMTRKHLRGVAKLEAFSQRVGLAAGRLELMRTLLQRKEVCAFPPQEHQQLGHTCNRTAVESCRREYIIFSCGCSVQVLCLPGTDTLGIFSSLS